MSDLGQARFDPEFIRQIIQKDRAPEEGWGYLKGIAVIRKNSFTIFPEILSDSFGDEIYSTRRMSQLEGNIVEGIPYGWIQGLSLPTRETVEKTVQMLFDEMQTGA